PMLRTGEGVPLTPRIPVSPAPMVSTDTAAQWKLVLAELWKRPSLGSQMERARLQASSSKEWVIALPDKFAVDAVQRSQVLIQETVAKIVGHALGVRFVQGDKGPVDEPE